MRPKAEGATAERPEAVGAEAAQENQDRAASIEEIQGLTAQGEYARAEEKARALLLDTERTLGPESLEAAEVLDLLVEALYRGGKAATSDARELAERALRIKENLRGPDDPIVAATLAHYGEVLRQRSELSRAKEILERALRIREASLEPDDPDLSRSRMALANVLTELGLLEQARTQYEQELAAAERRLEGEDYALAPILYNLARLLRRIGEYPEAERDYRSSLEIVEKTRGPQHPLVSLNTNGLAIVNEELGNYVEAKKLYERALDLAVEKLGPEHPYVASYWNNIGYVLEKLGDYAGAENAYRKSLKIGEAVYQPDDPATASTIGNLGDLYFAQARYPEAKESYEKSLKILESALGPEHPAIPPRLKTLATVYQKMGDYPTARSLLERALRITEKTLGPEHPDTGRTLNLLGILLDEMGELDAARAAYERALRICERVLGPAHPTIAEFTKNYATLLARMDDREQAFDLAIRAEEISRDHLRITAGGLPERQALGYAGVRTGGLDLALTLAAAGAEEDARRECWDSLIRSRAIVLDEMAARHRAGGDSSDPELVGLRDAYAEATMKLAHLFLQGPDPDDPDRYLGRLEAARKHKEDAERALGERSATFRQDRARSRLGYSDVAAALPPGWALLAYAVYGDCEAQLEAGSVRAANGAESLSLPGPPDPGYLVFLLRESDSAPVVLSLGSAAEIDRLVSLWRSQIASGAQGDETALREVGRELRRKIWDPVAAVLGDVDRLFVVPDGALHLVNFSALPSSGSRYLIEDGPLIHYLSAERDLVPDESSPEGGRGLLAVGGPDFDASSPFAELRPDSGRSVPEAADDVARYRGQLPGCEEFHEVRFEPLPGSTREADEIVAIWKKMAARRTPGKLPEPGGPDSMVVHLNGPAATEGAFKEEAAGKRILHLATHGFFLEGTCLSATTDRRGIGGLGPMKPPAPPPPAMENPLLLSGLVLAGANHREDAGPDEEDGILTAEEIAALDLSGVRWAVLSACDTGTGEVRAGEGVLGLRRAFQIAGAGTVIMSLWPVEDESARRWMSWLYRARFLEGMDTAEAVRQSTLEALRWRREQGLSTHPLFWAGFVAAGDWR